MKSVVWFREIFASALLSRISRSPFTYFYNDHSLFRLKNNTRPMIPIIVAGMAKKLLCGCSVFSVPLRSAGSLDSSYFSPRFIKSVFVGENIEFLPS